MAGLSTPTRWPRSPISAASGNAGFAGRPLGFRQMLVHQVTKGEVQKIVQAFVHEVRRSVGAEKLLPGAVPLHQPALAQHCNRRGRELEKAAIALLTVPQGLFR